MHLIHDPLAQAAATIQFDEFLKVDIRIGAIIKAEIFKKARKPSYILHIDFGATIGVKKSSAQITENYTCDQLIGKKIAAVVNFPSRQIGPIQSEVLTVGFPDKEGHVVLFSPDKDVPNGSRLF